MCGRTLIGESKDLANRAGVEDGGASRGKDNNRPPGSEMPVILDARPGKLHFVMWGLIPSYATEKPKFSTTYARIETMQQLPTYSHLIGKRHCVFVLDAIYEFDRSVKPSQPYIFKRKDGGVIFAAGLWDTWRDPKTDIVIPTATMIMQKANNLVSPIHDRMACILNPQEMQTWLNRDLHVNDRLQVLRPVGDDVLSGWMVDKKLNNLRNKDEDNDSPIGTELGD